MTPRMTEEVRDALARGAPVVALETSVVAQGLPSPVNLETARACEDVVRSLGAVPAPTAVVDGVLRVGLEPEALERLASGETSLVKVGSRDLPQAVLERRTGGTTVSATCELAAAVGIRLFATGGIGGVHRGVERHLDISQDLWALARFPVAVVCAGAKSVLDLPKTLEALESLGVPVVGVGTRDFPSFYSRESGLGLEHSVRGAEDAARLVRIRFDELRQSGGLLFAQPPPEAVAIERSEVEGWIQGALEAAEREGVQGKAVTPYLLSQLATRSEGRTLKTNVALIVQNARFAAEVAVALAR
jgi:pseudouridylate synthase